MDLKTSAIAVDGNNQNGQTETWNGTSWTEVNDLNTGRTAFSGGAVDNTNAVVFAGNLPGFTTKTANCGMDQVGLKLMI